jgi:hypothetical protein
MSLIPYVLPFHWKLLEYMFHGSDCNFMDWDTVVLWTDIDISDEHSASMFRIEVCRLPSLTNSQELDFPSVGKAHGAQKMAIFSHHSTFPPVNITVFLERAILSHYSIPHVMKNCVPTHYSHWPKSGFSSLPPHMVLTAHSLKPTYTNGPILQSWRRRQHLPLKCCCPPTSLHRITTPPLPPKKN